MKSSKVEFTTEAFTGDVIDALPTRRGIGGMLENAMLAASENRCRALLAKNALEDTGAMALAVGRLSHMAPAGKEFYQKILRAYAETTAQQIEKWGRF